MFELAAEGAWPAADKPLRRYYSGANTSGWAATEVARDVPTEWTVVTVDLWKDCGDFTLATPVSLRRLWAGPCRSSTKLKSCHPLPEK